MGSLFSRVAYTKLPASLFEDLVEGCRMGDVLIVRKAVEDGADPNWQDDSDNDFSLTPLGEACVDGNEEIVSLLLENGANVHVTDYEGKSPLHVASLRNHRGVVMLLLQKGRADPNFKNKFGRTALHDATQSGHLSIVKLLLMSGANPSIQYKCPLTPLHHACWNSSQEIAELLLKYKASSVAQNIDTGATPIHYTVNNRDVESTALLCRHGVDIHHLDQNCNSVMSIARNIGDQKGLAIVRELIKAKLQDHSCQAVRD